MKKSLMAICTIVFLSALFYSCNEKETGSAGDGGEKTAAVKIQKSAPSLIIYTGWDLYEERADGKMYAVGEAETGDAVKIYLNDDDSIQQKKAVRHLQSGKEESLDFVRVQYEGKDFWTRDIFVSGPGVCLSWVMTENAFAYSAPDGASITGTQIDEGTFLAAEDGQIDGVNGFYKAVIYNGRPFGKEIYLQSETFTHEPILKEIARTFSKIDEKTKPEVRDEIFLKFYHEAAGFEEWERFYFVKKLIEANKKSLVSEKVKEVLSETIYQNIFDDDFKISE